MRRRAAIWWLAACCAAGLACGKYGPPIRADQKDHPTRQAEPSPPQAPEATP